MKRLTMAVALLLLVAMGSYVVFAQQQPPTDQQQTQQGTQGMMGGGMMGRGMMGRGMMGQGMMGQGGPMGHMQFCPTCGAMMGAMMWKAMTPTQDGGVIVAFGNKLMRYDSQLNLVKETEMKIDMDQMYGEIQKTAQNCPMYRQMQQQPQAQAQPQ